MVKLITLISALAGMSSAVLAAPASGVTITVKNKCSKSIQVNQLTNVVGNSKSTNVAAGSSTSVNVDSTWGGRIWARDDCSGSSDCHPSAPASLAEFLLSGAAGQDYYDVSFVDGFNLPITIAPNSGTVSGYKCGSPSCSSLPSCPSELQEKDDSGNFIACKSACAAYGTDEYCCTGSAAIRGNCGTNSYATAVKSACPDVYSYAYDDSTSMYACEPASGYTVTFC